MGEWLRGNPVTILQRWYLVDPLTGVATPHDPTLTTFTVEDPVGVETAYTFGADPEVTNPEEGVYLLTLASPPPEPPGVFRWRAVAAGSLVAANEGTFEILDSLVLDDVSALGYGPCAPWIEAADVIALDSSIDEGDAFKLADAAEIGSAVMWALSGRQFDGLCRRTVRPCRDACGCFAGAPSVGLWLWGGSLGGGLSGGWWTNDCGDQCGCGTLSVVRLDGNPVRKIVEATVDGVAVDPGFYRLDGNQLVATNGNRWPSCQRLDLDDGPGTFVVRYLVGDDPPELGKLAAAQLALEVYRGSQPGGKCALPSTATRVVRQGVTIEKIATLSQVFKGGATGLKMVDLFLASANPHGMISPPMVLSPDLPRPRQVS